jgi:hypothetical protein
MPTFVLVIGDPRIGRRPRHRANDRQDARRCSAPRPRRRKFRVTRTSARRSIRTTGARPESSRQRATGRAPGGYRFHKIDMEEVAALADELEQGLRSALAQDKLIIKFDPVINLALGSVVRADANLIWMHPQQGLIPVTGDDMAEEAGLHEPIAAQFIRRACEAAARMQLAAPRKAVISMRLTARQAQQADLISVIDSAVRASGADPDLIRSASPRAQWPPISALP